MRAGSAPGSHDVISTYDYLEDGTGQNRGSLVDEKSYRGDTQTVGVESDVCYAALPSAPAYWDHYTYQYGRVKTASYISPSTSLALPFKTLDYDALPGTALIGVSRATDTLPTSLTYQAWGALASSTAPGQAMVSYTYSPATATTPAHVDVVQSDVSTTYEYDGLGRPIRTKRTLPGAGCVEQVTTYDGLGRTDTRSPWRACDSAGPLTTYRYDALGRVTSVATPDNQVTFMGYTGSRLVDRTVNISGKSTRTREEYDVFHRLLLVTENANGALPQRTSYAYDSGDRLTAVAMSSPAGTQTRKFTYDNRGFLLSETHPELGANGYGTTSYQNLNAAIEDQRGYDARGHSHYAQTGSRITTFEYDAAERLLRERDGTSRLLKELAYDSGYGCDAPLCLGKVAATARYHYDANLGNPAVSEGYRYDPATGKPQTRYTTVGTTSFILTQTYDTLGAIDTIRYPCHTLDSVNCDAIHDFTVKNTYTNGLLTKVGTLANLAAFSSGISYHPSGIVNTVNHSNGAFESWSADALGRPGGITARNRSGGVAWVSNPYAYDGAGNITRAGDTTYTYDAFGRLTSSTITNADGSYDTASPGYDRYGNLLQRSLSGCSPPATRRSCYETTVVAPPIQGTTNHYTDLQYDDAGNVISGPMGSFTYDGAGTLARAVVQGHDFRFLYTASDERVAAYEITPANLWTFMGRGFDDKLLNVWTMSGSNVQWKEDEIWRDSTLLARTTPSTTQHYAVDHLGSPRLITNSSDFTASTQSFAPFGAGGASNSGALQFTGQERDAANLGAGSVPLPDYFHARYYDTDRGRFLSPDIKLGNRGNPQSWNRYAYVANNPINLTDPTGESWSDVRAWFRQSVQSATIYFGLALPSDGAVRREYVSQVRKVNAPRGRNPAREALRDEARARSSMGGRAIAREMDKRLPGGLTPNRTNTGVDAALDAAEKGGKVMFVVGVVVTAYNVNSAPEGDRGRVAAQEVGAWTGAFIGGEIGGGVGAGIGTALGASEGGAPAVPGAVIGAVGGAFVGASYGGNLGAQIAGDLYDRIGSYPWD